MATLKEDVQSFIELSGAPDVNAARETITGWRDRAAAAPNPEEAAAASTQLNEIFNGLGVLDFDAAIEAIGNSKAQLAALHGGLGATDQPGAIAALDKMRTDFTAANNRVTELEAAAGDFESRVSAEVITRAASAGIPAPVAKDARHADGAPSNTISRADFTRLDAAAQLEFVSRKGSTITA